MMSNSPAAARSCAWPSAVTKPASSISPPAKWAPAARPKLAPPRPQKLQKFCAPLRHNKLQLAKVIRQLRPHTVILPYWEARHPDHYHSSTLGYEGCFLAGLKQLPIEGEPFRPFKILYSISFATVQPTFVVDITPQYEKRRQAILAYGSQFRPGKSAAKSKVFLGLDSLEDEMNRLARHYGQMIGVKYGEPFLTKELMQVHDVVKMDVRSI
jgi:hypothetical protein